MCSEAPAIDELLTAEQVAEVLKVHVTTVCRLAKSGRLRAYRVGEGTTSPRGLRIERSAVTAFLAASLIAAADAA
jgi:excisionase family DNA binding protein